MPNIYRRLAKLEQQRRPQKQGPMLPFEALDPTIAAMWLAVDLDINRLSLEQLERLHDELKRHV